MKKGIKILIALGVLALIGIGIFYYYVYSPNTKVNDDGIIYIDKNDSFDKVVKTLEERNYLKNAHTFRTIAELKKYPSLIKGGRYQIKSGLNNNELVNMLRAGSQAAINLTFNNIRSLDQLASILSRTVGIDSTEFMDLVQNDQFVNNLGFTKETIVGMFIPNTYQIYWNISSEDFIKRMNREYNKFWNEKRIEKAQAAGLSPMDATIIASIVEEETIKPEEYPIIAGVYINRLNRNMTLDACPTLKFAWNDFTLTRILNRHMEIDSPYNTYRNPGLPPGPVRITSSQIIDSVLNYQPHDYLFFCAKADFSGGHNFSKTLRQHNEYAAQYHRALNERGIY